MESLAHEVIGLRRPILCKKNEETHRAAEAEGRYTPVFHRSGAKTAHSFQKAYKRLLKARQPMSTVAETNKKAAKNCPENRPAADP